MQPLSYSVPEDIASGINQPFAPADAASSFEFSEASPAAVQPVSREDLAHQAQVDMVNVILKGRDKQADDYLSKHRELDYLHDDAAMQHTGAQDFFIGSRIAKDCFGGDVYAAVKFQITQVPDMHHRFGFDEQLNACKTEADAATLLGKVFRQNTNTAYQKHLDEVKVQQEALAKKKDSVDRTWKAFTSGPSDDAPLAAADIEAFEQATGLTGEDVGKLAKAIDILRETTDFRYIDDNNVRRILSLVDDNKNARSLVMQAVRDIQQERTAAMSGDYTGFVARGGYEFLFRAADLVSKVLPGGESDAKMRAADKSWQEIIEKQNEFWLQYPERDDLPQYVIDLVLEDPSAFGFTREQFELMLDSPNLYSAAVSLAKQSIHSSHVAAFKRDIMSLAQGADEEYLDKNTYFSSVGKAVGSLGADIGGFMLNPGAYGVAAFNLNERDLRLQNPDADPLAVSQQAFAQTAGELAAFTFTPWLVGKATPRFLYPAVEKTASSWVGAGLTSFGKSAFTLNAAMPATQAVVQRIGEFAFSSDTSLHSAWENWQQAMSWENLSSKENVWMNIIFGGMGVKHTRDLNRVLRMSREEMKRMGATDDLINKARAESKGDRAAFNEIVQEGIREEAERNPRGFALRVIEERTKQAKQAKQEADAQNQQNLALAHTLGFDFEAAPDKPGSIRIYSDCRSEGGEFRRGDVYNDLKREDADALMGSLVRDHYTTWADMTTAKGKEIFLNLWRRVMPNSDIVFMNRSLRVEEVLRVAKKVREELAEISDKAASKSFLGEALDVPSVGSMTRQNLLTLADNLAARRQVEEQRKLLAKGEEAEVPVFVLYPRQLSEGQTRVTLMMAEDAPVHKILEEVIEQKALSMMSRGELPDRLQDLQSLVDYLKEKGVKGADTILGIPKEAMERIQQNKATADDEALLHKAVVEGLSRVGESLLWRDILEGRATMDPSVRSFLKGYSDAVVDVGSLAPIGVAVRDAVASGKALSPEMKRLLGSSVDSVLKALEQEKAVSSEDIRKAYTKARTEAFERALRELSGELGESVPAAEAVAREAEAEVLHERSLPTDRNLPRDVIPAEESVTGEPLDLKSDPSRDVTPDAAHYVPGAEVPRVRSPHFVDGICTQDAAGAKTGLIPVSRIVVDDALFPQFKERMTSVGWVRANGDGIVAPLSGDWRVTSPPISCMLMKDGRIVVVTGRHRLAKAREQGVENIKVDLYEEGQTLSDGTVCDTKWARLFDVESNILDGKAATREIAYFFRNNPMTYSDAVRRGLIIRKADGTNSAVSTCGMAIGSKEAFPDNAYNLYVNRLLSDAEAYAIATMKTPLSYKEQACNDYITAKQEAAKSKAKKKPELSSILAAYESAYREKIAEERQVMQQGGLFDMFGGETTVVDISRGEWMTQGERLLKSVIDTVERYQREQGSKKGKIMDYVGIEMNISQDAINNLPKLKVALQALASRTPGNSKEYIEKSGWSKEASEKMSFEQRLDYWVKYAKEFYADAMSIGASNAFAGADFSMRPARGTSPLATEEPVMRFMRDLKRAVSDITTVTHTSKGKAQAADVLAEQVGRVLGLAQAYYKNIPAEYRENLRKPLRRALAFAEAMGKGTLYNRSRFSKEYFHDLKKQIQDMVPDLMADGSPLPPRTKADAKKAEKEAKTEATFRVSLQEMRSVFAEVARAVESSAEKLLTDASLKTWKRLTKAASTSPIARKNTYRPNKFDAETDRRRQAILAAADLSPEARAERVQKVTEELNNLSRAMEDARSEADLLELEKQERRLTEELNTLITYGALKHRSYREIRNANAQFSRLITEGMEEWSIKLEERYARLNEYKEAASSVMVDNAALKSWRDAYTENSFRGLWLKLKTAATSLMSPGQLLYSLRNTKGFENFIRDMQREVADGNQGMLKRELDAHAALGQFMEAAGLTSHKAKNDFMQELNLVKDTGIDVTSPKTGNTTRLKLSKNQALNLVLLLEQPAYFERSGAAHGYTQEVLDALRSFVGPEALSIGHAMRDYLENDGLRDTFAERTGIYIPESGTYWPGRFDNTNRTSEEPALGLGGAQNKNTYDFLRERVAHIADFDLNRSATQTFFSAIGERSGYMSYGNTCDLFARLIRSYSFSRALYQQAGHARFLQLKDAFKVLSNAGHEISVANQAISRLIGAAQSAKAYALLAGNISTYIKQGSALGHATAINGVTPINLAATYSKLISGNWAGHISRAELISLPCYRVRYEKAHKQNVRAAWRELATLPQNSTYSRAQQIARYGMHAIEKVDLEANVLAGAAVYNITYERLTKENASRADKLTEEQIRKACENTVADMLDLSAQPLVRQQKSIFAARNIACPFTKVTMYMGGELTNKIGMLLAKYKADGFIEAFKYAATMSSADTALLAMCSLLYGQLPLQSDSDQWQAYALVQAFYGLSGLGMITSGPIISSIAYSITSGANKFFSKFTDKGSFASTLLSAMVRYSPEASFSKTIGLNFEEYRAAINKIAKASSSLSDPDKTALQSAAEWTLAGSASIRLLPVFGSLLGGANSSYQAVSTLVAASQSTAAFLNALRLPASHFKPTKTTKTTKSTRKSTRKSTTTESTSSTRKTASSPFKLSSSSPFK